MKEAGKILAYAAAVVIAGCLLAPPLWWGAQALVDAGLAPFLAPFPFPKYVNRGVLIAAVLLLVPFLRWVGVTSPAALGVAPNRRRWQHLGAGVGIGLAGLLVVASVLMAVGMFRWRKHIHVGPIAAVVAGAWVVAILEEVFFRGALLGVVRRRLSWPKALTFVSLLFAALHFIKSPKRYPDVADVGWLTGFRVAPELLWQWSEPRLVVGGFTTLVLVGAILGYSVVKTRSLYFAVGLHAGWVMALRGFDYLTTRQAEASMWFGKDLVTGLAPVLMLLVTFAVVVLILRRLPAAPDTRELPS